MKRMYRFIYSNLIVIFCLLFLAGCEDTVDPQVFSELTPETLLTTENGVEGTLLAGYAELADTPTNAIRFTEEFTTDIAWETGGGANQWALLFINLIYDPSSPHLPTMWNKRFRAIRNANIVLDNIENLADVNESKKELFSAEARFIRAASYIKLFNWFGTTPLRTSTEDPLELPRAGEEELLTFIESELLSAIEILPEFGNEPAYGRAHKDAARGFLARIFLNTKQWQKAADITKEIIDGSRFDLYPSYPDMFRVENERNSEYIWVTQVVTSNGPGNVLMNAALPPAFKEYPPLEMVFTPNMNNWARQDRLMDDWADSFEEGDQRRMLIADWYINMDGDTVSLRELRDNQRAFKYPLDPNAQGNSHGNDIPEIRYADILLQRAEALNELNGPNQESINLINEVRNRAGLDDLSLTQFTSKEELRDHIVMKERGWEFYFERKRRQDLIRIDKFIETSRELGSKQSNRGNANAEEFLRLFPIPQIAIDANPNLEQNPGY